MSFTGTELLFFRLTWLKYFLIWKCNLVELLELIHFPFIQINLFFVLGLLTIQFFIHHIPYTLANETKGGYPFLSLKSALKQRLLIFFVGAIPILCFSSVLCRKLTQTKFYPFTHYLFPKKLIFPLCLIALFKINCVRHLPFSHLFTMVNVS